MLHLGLQDGAAIEPMSPDRFKRLLHKYLGPEESWNQWFIDNVARYFGKRRPPKPGRARSQAAGVHSNGSTVISGCS
ncbi:hypothetical protein DEV91_1095 [Phyllobacterium brassicacearum]|nr:hypothetical protein DEV91_1095 [Phyllobacterium brassicacearum]